MSKNQPTIGSPAGINYRFSGRNRTHAFAMLAQCSYHRASEVVGTKVSVIIVYFRVVMSAKGSIPTGGPIVDELSQLFPVSFSTCV